MPDKPGRLRTAHLYLDLTNRNALKMAPDAYPAADLESCSISHQHHATVKHISQWKILPWDIQASFQA
jgi:hypothetical protein